MERMRSIKKKLFGDEDSVILLLAPGLAAIIVIIGTPFVITGGIEFILKKIIP